MTLHYIAFPSLHPAPLTIGARLTIPAGPGPHPAVILLHGSSGPTGREGGHAAALNAAGFVTLEPDQWAPRGLGGGAGGRPGSVHETLPDLYGARAFLAGRPEVDLRRIGVAGFSFGGVAVMLAATSAIDQAHGGGDGGPYARAAFAAYLAYYPVCHVYNRAPGFDFEALVAAPILIATASLDEYDDNPTAGPDLVKSLSAMDRATIRTAVFHGVHHAFDIPGVDQVVDDPYSHRGRGGPVTMRHDPEATARAHTLTVQFFSEMRKPPAGPGGR